MGRGERKMIGRCNLGFMGIKARFKESISITGKAYCKVCSEHDGLVLFYEYIIKLITNYLKGKKYDSSLKIVRYENEIIIMLADEKLE